MAQPSRDADPLERVQVRIHYSALVKLREIAHEEQRGWREQAGVLLERAIARYKITETAA